MLKASPAARGAFRSRAPPNHSLYPPKREVCPQREDCVLKKSNKPGATGVHFGACALQNTVCAPSSLSEISFQDEKHESIPRLRLRAEDLFLWSSPVNLWARSKIRTIRFRRVPPGNERAPLSETCAPQKGKRPERNFFLVFPPKS